MDRTGVELSESPAVHANDTKTRSCGPCSADRSEQFWDTSLPDTAEWLRDNRQNTDESGRRPLTHRPLRARSPRPFRLFQQARQNVPQWLLTFSKRLLDSGFCPIVMLSYESLRLSWFCGWGNLSTVHSLGCSCGVDVGEDVLFIALVVYPFHNKFRRHSICPLPAKNAHQ